MKVRLFLLSYLLLMFQPADAAEIKTQSRKVILAYTSISPSYAPAWIAKELKIFDRNGINAEVIYARGAVLATQALVGGDVSFICKSSEIDSGLVRKRGDARIQTQA